MAGYIETAKNAEWCTPERVLVPLREFFEGPPDLDPCDNAGSYVGAARRIWHGEWVQPLPPGVEIGDGLAIPWSGKVYVNPPYGKGLGLWIAKCHEEHLERAAEVVALLPSYTGLAAFHDHVSHAAAVCFIRGRLRFVGAENGAGFASLVAYWGRRPGAFDRAFSSIGHVMWP